MQFYLLNKLINEYEIIIVFSLFLFHIFKDGLPVPNDGPNRACLEFRTTIKIFNIFSLVTFRLYHFARVKRDVATNSRIMIYIITQTIAIASHSYEVINAKL